jgi:hypothetical protein
MNPPPPDFVTFVVFLGATGTVVATLYVIFEVISARRAQKSPQCHDCGWALKPLHLYALPLEDDGSTEVPPGATWYCPHCRPVRYYGAGTGKGAMIDEV